MPAFSWFLSIHSLPVRPTHRHTRTIIYISSFLYFGLYCKLDLLIFIPTNELYVKVLEADFSLNSNIGLGAIWKSIATKLNDLFLIRRWLSVVTNKTRMLFPRNRITHFFSVLRKFHSFWLVVFLFQEVLHFWIDSWASFPKRYMSKVNRYPSSFTL